MQLAPSLLPEEPENCTVDEVFNVMEFMNTYFADHVDAKKAFLIIAAGIEDIMMLSLFGYYIVKGSSYRMPVAFALFYVVRAIFSVSHTTL